MLIYRLDTPSGARYATEHEGVLEPLADLPDALTGGVPSDHWNDLQQTDLRVAAFLPPIEPRKIVAIGLNYRDHIRESGLAEPSAPLVFSKFPSSICGPSDEIRIDPSITTQVDWEGELGVIVGTRMRNVSVEDALDHVFGYTVANDVSARDVQFGDGQWVRGKSQDTFCPVGPAILTADEVPDPQNLHITTRVNGEVVQSSSTSEMVFSVAEILSYCSRNFTLDPGDLVLTGTPWGCGGFMDPPRYLAAGDVVDVEIPGIGRLSNAVRVERVPAPRLDMVGA